jgi:hypothetical protein
MKRTTLILLATLLTTTFARAADDTRTYQNNLTPITNPKPLLADHPEFIDAVKETQRFEAPALIEDESADLSVRAWRFSYNARGIIEMPNHLRAADTAIIVVHPWAIDDGQGWNSPTPCGVSDFCTPTKNHLGAKHTKEIVNPFLKSLRNKVAFVMYSLPGDEDPIRHKIYRSFRGKPSDADRAQGLKDLDAKLRNFNYTGEPLKKDFAVSTSSSTTVADYFKQFPGLDPGPRYDPAGFWDQPIAVTRDIDSDPNDVIIYDKEGYPPLRDFLKANHIRHVLLTGYATDMCYEKTTAGFRNLSPDFNVFLVGDATLATFPANDSPAHATNAAISFASLEHLITQTSWIKYQPSANASAK